MSDNPSMPTNGELLTPDNQAQSLASVPIMAIPDPAPVTAYPQPAQVTSGGHPSAMTLFAPGPTDESDNVSHDL